MSKTRQEKIEICESCPMFLSRTRQCAVCHCFIDLKAAIPIFNCPRDKWK